MKKIKLNKDQAGLLAIIAAVLAGALLVLAIRFINYKPTNTHYHANFAVYINGQREQFNGPTYYEEESMGSCTTDKEMIPADRAHMHDNENDVIHVHDKAVTWQ